MKLDVLVVVSLIAMLSLFGSSAIAEPLVHENYCDDGAEDHWKGRFRHNEEKGTTYVETFSGWKIITPDAADLLIECGIGIFDYNKVGDWDDSWDLAAQSANTIGVEHLKPEMLHAEVVKRLLPNYDGARATKDMFCILLADSNYAYDSFPEVLGELMVERAALRISDHGYAKKEYEYKLLYSASILAEEVSPEIRKSDFLDCAREFEEPID